MKSFPLHILTWSTLAFLVCYIAVQGLFVGILEHYQIELTREHLYLAFSVLALLTYVGVLGFTLRPLMRVNRFLNILLNQPKTENIRVDDDEFNEVFKRGEWKELGALARKLERKLRRRTKALLREATELSAVMDSLDSPVIAVTTTMEVSFLNSAFAVLFDINSRGSERNIRSKTIYELLNEKKLIGVLERALQNEDFEMKMLPITSTGRDRVFSVSMTPLRRRYDNSLYGVVALLNDETLKVELDQKRMDFVANASHELRTPIAAVSASVSILKKTDDESVKSQVMESLDVNAKRLVSLTSELLDLSKLEGEVDQVEWNFVDLKQMTNEVLNILSHPRKTEVSVSYGATEACFDESKVKQVLTNLIRNALIYTSEGTKVEVDWSKQGTQVVLTVRDWGEGIPTKEQGRIFERFYRVDKSRSRRVGGSGIGLSIVKHIMHLHGGDVRLSPYIEGLGAEFKCSFPQKFKD